MRCRNADSSVDSDFRWNEGALTKSGTGRLSASSISFDENPTPRCFNYDQRLWRDSDRRMNVICRAPRALSPSRSLGGSRVECLIWIGCRSACNWCGPIRRNLRSCHSHRSLAPKSSRQETEIQPRPARSRTGVGRHFSWAGPALSDLASAGLVLSRQPRRKRSSNCCKASNVGIDRSDLNPRGAIKIRKTGRGRPMASRRA
jgi:hypothetical protein